jgi:hypothetical protein
MAPVTVKEYPAETTEAHGMRTVIELHGTRTAIEGGETSGPDKAVRAMLALNYAELQGEYSPDRDYQAASEFVARHGGRIVEQDETGTEESVDIVF